MCSNLSNFNYKPQAESRQQHLSLYMDRYLRSVAMMIEVTSQHQGCGSGCFSTASTNKKRKNDR